MQRDAEREWTKLCPHSTSKLTLVLFRDFISSNETSAEWTII